MPIENPDLSGDASYILVLMKKTYIIFLHRFYLFQHSLHTVFFLSYLLFYYFHLLLLWLYWCDILAGTIFKSWKKRYVVLYKDGELSVYDNPNQASADSRIHLKADCKRINVGFACGSMNLPKGQSNVDSLFCVETKGGKEYYFAAASDRECKFVIFDWLLAVYAIVTEKYR